MSAARETAEPNALLLSFPLSLPIRADLPEAGAVSPQVCARVNSRRVLRLHSASPYTALVTTHGRKAAPVFDHHVERLELGGRTLLKTPICAAPSLEGNSPKTGSEVPVDGIQGFRYTVLHAIHQAVDTLERDSVLSNTGNADEALVVPFLSKTLVSCDNILQHVMEPSNEQGEDVTWFHIVVQHTKVAKPTPVVVEARGKPRRQAHVKNTAWVEERRALEDARADDAEESILVGADAKGSTVLLEGLVTNFFVITREGSLQTADEHVLKGSVRKIVLECAEGLGIKTELKAPALSDIESFELCFLTNATKVLTPVVEIRFPTFPEMEDLRLPCSSQAMRILNELRTEVIKRMHDKSTFFLQ